MNTRREKDIIEILTINKEVFMTGEEIKATKLTKLVQRLFVIDATLTKETSQLVTEYNEIIEEIWTILEGVELKTDPLRF